MKCRKIFFAGLSALVITHTKLGSFAVMALALSGAAPMAALAEGPVGTSGGPEITNIRGCVAYEHENFAGSSFDIVDGTRRPHIGDDWNDRISSIACSSG